MKKYDYKMALEFINKNQNHIESVYLGMHEDWFWTADCVFENGYLEKDLSDNELDIAGINSSSWATPVIEINYKNGEQVTGNCFVGESDIVGPPAWFSYGCLSEDVQGVRSSMEVTNIGE